jgi:hypothetical protein
VGNSGFDHKTAADFLNGKTVSDEAVRKFVAASRWAHDERAALSATLLSVRGELASREAEIALLKKALLKAEAAPQQEAQEPALFVSAKQLADLADPSHATAGSYLPARKTRAGLFTMALYTAPQPAPAPLSDEALNCLDALAAPKAAPGERLDECFPGESRVAVPQGLISAACFAIRNKRDGGKVLEQLRRYSVGDLSQPLAPQQEAQEPTTVDQKTMEIAESVGLIGPASRAGDLHAAIQRFHDLICVNATIKAAVMAADAIRGVATPARDYPPLPMQFACSGVFAVYSADQMRAYVDADRAARAPADSVAAPAIGDELRDTLVAVSAAIAERDDRAAQKMIGEILAASPPPTSPAEQQAPSAAAADTVVLEAALRAIHQAIDLIGEPDTERLRTVRRVLRGAVIVAEDAGEAATAPQPAPHLPERDASLPAERQGLFRKFVVGRVDGSDKPGGKHHGCTYFVLDVDHDPCARPALAAYAAACESTHPTLAADLRTKWGVVPAPQPAPAPLSEQAEEAAMYRWLRAQQEDDSGELRCCVYAPNDMRECLVPVGDMPGELDAFIRAALAEQGGKA